MSRSPSFRTRLQWHHGVETMLALGGLGDADKADLYRQMRSWVEDRRNLSAITLRHEVQNFEQALAQTLELSLRTVLGKDNGTAGDMAELAWQEVLKQLLPGFTVVTKGTIAGDNGASSPQIDILVLDKDTGTTPANKVYHHRKVVAAFECKTTLTLRELRDAADKCAKLKTTVAPTEDPLGAPGIFFGLLALRSGIDNLHKDPADSLLDALRKCVAADTTGLELLDSIVVPAAVCLRAVRQIWCGDVVNEPQQTRLETRYDVLREGLDRYPNNSALGFFAQGLLARLEPEYPRVHRLREMYDHFCDAQVDAGEITSVPVGQVLRPQQVDDILAGKVRERDTPFEFLF